VTGVGHYWTRQAHTFVQGVKQSSKSMWTYGALAQMAGRPELLIAGCDRPGCCGAHSPAPATPRTRCPA
jgi:hypothetical protein